MSQHHYSIAATQRRNREREAARLAARDRDRLAARNAHVVTRVDEDGLLTVACTGSDGHHWSATAATTRDRAWVEESLAFHQGRGPAPFRPTTYSVDADGFDPYDDGAD